MSAAGEVLEQPAPFNGAHPKREIGDEFEYLARRAAEERALAAAAADPRIAMTHMYMASVYAQRMAELTALPPELDELLTQLS